MRWDWGGALDLGHILLQSIIFFFQEFLTKNANSKQYWIGLHDVSNEGTFIWVDDSSVSYRSAQSRSLVHEGRVGGWLWCNWPISTFQTH